MKCPFCNATLTEFLQNYACECPDWLEAYPKGATRAQLRQLNRLKKRKRRQKEKKLPFSFDWVQLIFAALAFIALLVFVVIRMVID